jgi:hypothetical protein
VLREFSKLSIKTGGRGHSRREETWFEEATSGRRGAVRFPDVVSRRKPSTAAVARIQAGSVDDVHRM